MAVEKIYSGDCIDKTWEITFPFITSTYVKVSVGGTTQDTPADYSISGTTVTFVVAPPNATNNIRLYRNTNIDNPVATYQAGSSIRSIDLNDNNKQLRYKIEEVGTVTANDEGLGLVAGDKNDITVNTATDWVIRNQAVEVGMMAVNSIDSDQYIDGSIDRIHLEADIIDSTKLANDSVNSEHYVDGSIEEQHVADNQITLAKMAGLARGKIIYGNSSGDPAALTVGTAGQVLHSDGTDVSWDTPIGAKGAGSDRIFWENDRNVTGDYTISDNTNAGSFGPITINADVTVTVGDGEHWSIV